MSLELWLQDQNLNQSFGAPITLRLPDGSIIIFSAENFTVIDFAGEITTSGTIDLTEDLEITTLLSVTPTADGGFTVIFGSGFSSLPSIYSVELDSNFEQVSPVATVFEDFGGSGAGTLLPDGSLAVIHDTFDSGARTTSLTIIQPDGTIDDPIQANTNENASSLFHQIEINDSVIFATWLDADAGRLRGRIFDLDGNTVGDAFDISTGAARDNSVQIDALSNGNFIVTWNLFDESFLNSEVFARLFDANGAPLGDPFTITPATNLSQSALDVLALDDGGFLFLWADRENGAERGTFIAQYDNDGQPIGDPLLLDGISSNAAIAPYGDGRFLVTDASTFTSYLIVDARMGNFDGDEGDNLLVGSATSASTINGFGGNDQFFGTDQDETFNGGEGNDILNGEGGDDILDGGAGDDTIFGGSGNDLITAGDGMDTIDAGIGDDVVTVEAPEFFSNDPNTPIVLSIVGGEGDDTLAFTRGRVFYDATDVSGFERLLVDSSEDFPFATITNLGGLQAIIVEGGQGGATLIGSDNSGANVTFSTPIGDRFRGFLELSDSTIGNVTGSDGSEAVIVGNGSFAGDVNLGGGDDFFQINAGSSLFSAITSLDAGGGDNDVLSYVAPEASINDSLNNVSGFELLAIGPPNQTGTLSHSFSNVSGFDALVSSTSLLFSSSGQTMVSASDITLSRGSTGDMSDTILSGALGGSFTITAGLVVESYIFYDYTGERPSDESVRSAAVSTRIINQGEILNEVDFRNGDDLYDGTQGLVGGAVLGNAGNDTLLGGAGAETFFGGLDADILNGGGGDDLLDGGSNVDTAVFAGNRSDYTITQTATGTFEIAGPDGTDTLTTIEFAQFDDETTRLLPGTGVSVDFETADPAVYQTAMNAIRDFDGNDLGGDGSWLRIGSADVNGDGDIDQILVNDAIGRFATVGTAPDDLVYFDDYSWAGETRVAGIYLDPLVISGDVEQGSANDSQRRFQNDLEIENINRVLGADDYDGDGLQEVYFALTDGTAYLRAIMEADGNIRYANYQSEQEVIDYLTANGFGEETFGDWFPSDENAQSSKEFAGDAAPLAPSDAPLASGDTSFEAASLWQGGYREFPAEFFG